MRLTATSDGVPVFKHMPEGARLLGEASLQPLKHHSLGFLGLALFLVFTVI